MDLAQLTTGNSTAKLHLRHPATEELLYADEAEKKPMTIELDGADSKRFRKVQANLQRRLGTKKKPTNDEVEKAVVEQLVGVTLGWSNIVMNGEEIVFDTETATKIYTEYMWIREQVASFISDRANFLTNV